MSLDEEEWDLVRCLVIDHLIGTPDPYGTLRMYFPDEVSGWQVSPVPARYAATIVESARRAPMSDPDPLAIRLLRVLLSISAIKVSAQQPQVQGFLDRLLKAKDALDADDPFRALILPRTGESFIDRTQTRTLLASLVRPDPTKPEPVAMRVVGPKKSGKSYTFSFILHLSEPRGITPVRVMLSRSSTAEDILRELSVPLVGPGEKPDPVTEPMKRLRHWAQWIVSHVERHNPPGSWWFVFDQCNELDPNSDAVEFIAQLAIAIREMTGPRLKRPRLVLLGYCDQLADLQLPRRQVYEDIVKIVSEADLRAFFGCVFREKDETRRPGSAPDEERMAKLVEVTVRHVVEEATTAAAMGTPYMKALGIAAEEAVDVYDAA